MKHKIRKEVLEKRVSYNENKLFLKSKKVKERLFSLNEFKNAKRILFYFDVKGEVRTKEMIKEALSLGKKICLPRTDFKTQEMKFCEIKNLNEVEKTKKGLFEPKQDCRALSSEDLKTIDLVIVPGVAFDAQGNRIGYGKGFYDKFLKKIDEKIPFIALAFEFQIVESIKAELCDVKINKIVTEQRVIEC